MAPAREKQMLNNLIESTSHVAEFKRRGFFFLFTVASYVVLFVVAGLVSILAYEAHLKDPKSELVVTMLPLPPSDVVSSEPGPSRPQPGGSGGNGNRVDPVRGVDHGTLFDNNAIPDHISSEPNPSLPFRKHFDATSNFRSGEGFGPGGPSGDRSGPARGIQVDIETPPPLRKAEQPPQILRKKVINSEALSLPKPPYPPLALQHGVRGTVTVQVLIDEGGTVISAKAVSGSPLLAPAAVTAAYKAKFSPTILGDQPVKVSGMITYNFVIQ